MTPRRLTCVLALLAAAAAAPSPPDAGWRFPDAAGDDGGDGWRFPDKAEDAGSSGGADDGERQERRIAGSEAVGLNSVALTTTTPRPTPKKRLVTLAPIGSSIQDILFNNGYRETPADAEPQPNSIDNYDNLDGLDSRHVWLLDNNLLVLRGGRFADGFVDTEPIDDFQAPYREPKFPPPGFLGDGELPPGLFGIGFVSNSGRSGPLIPELAGPYSPYAPYAEAYNSRDAGARRPPLSNGHTGYRLEAPRAPLALLTPTRRPHTYSVRTSYSSSSSMSSTSDSGPSDKYLPPPRDQSKPDPR